MLTDADEEFINIQQQQQLQQQQQYLRKGSAIELDQQQQQQQQGFDQFDYGSEFGHRSNSRAVSPAPSQRQESQQQQQLEPILNNHLTNDISSAAASRSIVRRNSSSERNRRGSLPSDYVAANSGGAIKLANDSMWSREHVATLAHEARQRAKNPPSNVKQTLAKIGVSLHIFCN